METEDLERLMQDARLDHTAEARFFRSLLTATLYAHAPLSDDQPRLRLIQFQHPDGFLVLPFFTSWEKANAAAQGAVKVMTFAGRHFFAITRGATLILNPNDECSVLYSEEVDALVTTGRIARIERDERLSDAIQVGAPRASPPWLIPILCDVYRRIETVTVAYLLQVYPPENPPEGATLIVMIGVAPPDGERAARASITAVQPHAAIARTHSIDISVFDPAGEPPACFASLELKPFYVRQEA